VTGMRAEIATALERGGLDPADVERVVRMALDEDLALGPDVTTIATVAEDARASGDVVPRTPGVLAGGAVAAAVFDLVGGAPRSSLAGRSSPWPARRGRC